MDARSWLPLYASRTVGSRQLHDHCQEVISGQDPSVVLGNGGLAVRTPSPRRSLGRLRHSGTRVGASGSSAAQPTHQPTCAMRKTQRPVSNGVKLRLTRRVPTGTSLLPGATG